MNYPPEITLPAAARRGYPRCPQKPFALRRCADAILLSLAENGSALLTSEEAQALHDALGEILAGRLQAVAIRRDA